MIRLDEDSFGAFFARAVSWVAPEAEGATTGKKGGKEVKGGQGEGGKACRLHFSRALSFFRVLRGTQVLLRSTFAPDFATTILLLFATAVLLYCYTNHTATIPLLNDGTQVLLRSLFAPYFALALPAAVAYFGAAPPAEMISSAGGAKRRRLDAVVANTNTAGDLETAVTLALASFFEVGFCNEPAKPAAEVRNLYFTVLQYYTILYCIVLHYTIIC